THNLLFQSYLMSFKSGETFSELAPPLSKVFHKWQDGRRGETPAFCQREANYSLFIEVFLKKCNVKKACC
ncbi:hypothetical protein WAH83_24395, partial [Acinetobacter baumannii]